MPTSICANDHLLRWCNQRGNRQPEVCPFCGYGVKLAQWNEDTGRYEQPRKLERKQRQPVIWTAPPADYVPLLDDDVPF